jgi:hypothetical protein
MRQSNAPAAWSRNGWNCTEVRYCIASALSSELLVAALTAIARLTPTTLVTLMQAN